MLREGKEKKFMIYRETYFFCEIFFSLLAWSLFALFTHDMLQFQEWLPLFYPQENYSADFKR
jgi:hypothetical protein